MVRASVKICIVGAVHVLFCCRFGYCNETNPNSHREGLVDLALLYYFPVLDDASIAEKLIKFFTIRHYSYPPSIVSPEILP